MQREFRAWRVRNYGKDNGREMFDKLDELVERDEISYDTVTPAAHARRGLITLLLYSIIYGL